MTDRPLLILPSPGDPVKRRKKGGGGGRFNRPGRDRQDERLTPRFVRLQQALEARRTRFQVEASGLVPEEVVVLETIGTVDGFIRAVEKVTGMEWLGEIEEEAIPPDDDFFAITRSGIAQPEKILSGRLFMVFANQGALEQMLTLWNAWKTGQNLPYGLGRWKQLFEQLRDIRPWGVIDRLHETGVLEDWKERVEHDEDVVPCEIELWHRRTLSQRWAARDRVTKLVEDQDGQVVNEVSLEEIAYHALLVRLPVNKINPLVQHLGQDMDLIQCEQIQFFRANAQMAAFLPDDSWEEDNEARSEESPAGAPIVALFDGLPLQLHCRLQGRLVIDDPDDFEHDYPASMRRHGTAMASLIIHGDMMADEGPVPRPLYVRPILRPDFRDWRNHEETVPEGTFVVDLLHRAVRRLFEEDGDEQAVAPDVAIINLSIGIRDRPFEQALSPLARLLDWLAWRYKVLFVVSAGNHTQRLELSLREKVMTSIAPEVLQREVIRSIAADARNRRLLSPAESVNAVTVAAVHEDASEKETPIGWNNPYIDGGLPSPINAQGMGYRRGIKPEVLAPGGRVVLREPLEKTDQPMVEFSHSKIAPGQFVAAPGQILGDVAAMCYLRGTSNAAALVSRAAGLLYDVVEELRDEPGGELIDLVPRSVWLKALIAHGAEWGAAGTVLESILGNTVNPRQFKEYVTRLLGYGSVDAERVSACTPFRVTAISGGILSEDQSRVHRFPLPHSVSGKSGYRRLTTSLAWFTPVNPRHQAWRRADLWFSPPKKELQIDRKQADWQAVQRGTLQHEILEGENAAAFEHGTNLEIQVNCRADAGIMEETVPYALATTLEVTQEIGVEIYDEVRMAVHAAQVRVAAGT